MTVKYKNAKIPKELEFVVKIRYKDNEFKTMMDKFRALAKDLAEFTDGKDNKK